MKKQYQKCDGDGELEQIGSILRRNRVAILARLMDKLHWYVRFKRLTEDEVMVMVDFIVENDHLDRDTFAEKVNRRTLDRADLKTKNWTLVDEILTNVNVHVPASPQRGLAGEIDGTINCKGRRQS